SMQQPSLLPVPSLLFPSAPSLSALVLSAPSLVVRAPSAPLALFLSLSLSLFVLVPSPFRSSLVDLRPPRLPSRGRHQESRRHRRLHPPHHHLRLHHHLHSPLHLAHFRQTNCPNRGNRREKIERCASSQPHLCFLPQRTLGADREQAAQIR